ncbi:hypothetical protein [Lacrimispora sp.]|uniref:hypothetical protein n=1 Tax=Lacrimispora sp. TaxID=2719234 RepID=UPI0028AA666C|nr:hypothetical protein [Lacrimispora sp.]
MKKPTTRKERLEFIEKKKGKRGTEIFLYMTDREVKKYFDLIYPSMKDRPDATDANDTIQCLRCGSDVEHHLLCACGVDRCVFSEAEWKDDIAGGNLSEMKTWDIEFIKNGYRVPDCIN